MTVIDVPDQSVRTHRIGWRRRGAYWWICLTAIGIAMFAPLPYFSHSLAQLSEQDNTLAANYLAHGPVFEVGLYLHIAGAATALLLSPAQFATRIRVRAPRLHRVIGRITFGAIAVGGTGALVLVPINLAGPVGVARFGLLAILWLSFMVAALRAIRRGDVAGHRRWAVRTFALTYAGVMLRLWLLVMVSAQGLWGVDPDLGFTRAYYLTPFLAWVPNLLVAEWFLGRRRLRPGPGTRAGR